MPNSSRAHAAWIKGRRLRSSTSSHSIAASMKVKPARSGTRSRRRGDRRASKNLGRELIPDRRALPNWRRIAKLGNLSGAYQEGNIMNPFKQFLTDTLTLRKGNGTVHTDIKAAVDSCKIG